jgi:membrane-associated protein
MEIIKYLIDFILHLDKHLPELVLQYHTWTYLILFLIVFCETGLVITPFLPGDSLLFAAGTLAGSGKLDLVVLMLVLYAAAFIGDNTNYFIGRWVGPAVFEKNFRLLKKEYLLKTQSFYDKHGGKTLIIARFMPILRTFAPFVAGVGNMVYKRFLGFSLLGNFLWIVLFITAGFYFGKLEFIQKHFSLVTLAIISISLLPVLIGIVNHKLKTNKGTPTHRI